MENNSFICSSSFIGNELTLNFSKGLGNYILNFSKKFTKFC